MFATSHERAVPAPAMQGVSLRDGAELRTAVWRPEGPARGTVFLFTGFAEFIEKYLEVAADLVSRRWAVVGFDWRGQGHSTRAHPKRRGWVTDYGELVDDALEIRRWALQMGLPMPLVILGHSMGGHLAIRLLEDHTDQFDAAVATAPMLGLIGFPNWLLRGLAGTGHYLGLGRRYAPGAGDNDPHGPHIALSSDPARIERWRTYLRADAQLITHGVTWRWVREAARSIHRITRPERAAAIRTPLLLVNPQADSLVDSRATSAFAPLCPRAELIDVPACGHEILQENDALRAAFWQQFDAFVDRHCPASGG